MEEIIKKFIYTSVGLVSQTTTKIGEVIDELIKDRKISEEEGKRIVEDFTNKTKNQTKDFEEQVRSFSSKFTKESGASAEEEIAQLKAKIKALESKLSQSGKNETAADTDATNRITMEEDPLQEKKELFRQKLHEQSNDPVDKVVHNKHVNLDDEILTPQKKIEAEQQRMQTSADRSSIGRGEQDTQQTNLSGPILTPDKKVEQDKGQGT